MNSNIPNKLAEGPRKIVVTGHFGCGKTEFSVSLAVAFANMGIKPLALADLDIENPYFRSRERGDELEEMGITVYSDPFNGRNGTELQTISASIKAPLEDESCRAILDCGGDAPGAMVLNQFGKYLKKDTNIISVVNCMRPGTDTPEKAADMIRQTENATGLKVNLLISNAHLIRYTTEDVIKEGYEFSQKVSQMCGIPLLGACCMESLAGKLEGCGFDIFPIGMYMRDTYLDKTV